MNVWFADTSYWIALLNSEDELHQRARELNERFDGIIVTTQWILAELPDGCSNQAMRESVTEFIRVLELRGDVSIAFASDEAFHRGFELYARRLDKEWSLTDCISFLVMQERDISEALTADHHFEQAGFVALLKEKAL